jgi:hypothetical protein
MLLVVNNVQKIHIEQMLSILKKRACHANRGGFLVETTPFVLAMFAMLENTEQSDLILARCVSLDNILQLGSFHAKNVKVGDTLLRLDKTTVLAKCVRLENLDWMGNIAQPRLLAVCVRLEHGLLLVQQSVQVVIINHILKQTRRHAKNMTSAQTILTMRKSCQKLQIMLGAQDAFMPL